MRKAATRTTATAPIATAGGTFAADAPPVPGGSSTLVASPALRDRRQRGELIGHDPHVDVGRIHSKRLPRNRAGGLRHPSVRVDDIGRVEPVLPGRAVT